MKNIVLLFCIILFTQCADKDCIHYYYYSSVHENSMIKDDFNYKPKFVEGYKFTVQTNKEYLSEYRQLWNDPYATRVYKGCIDTLNVTSQTP